jgi:hypothetical protein
VLNRLGGFSRRRGDRANAAWYQSLLCLSRYLWGFCHNGVTPSLWAVGAAAVSALLKPEIVTEPGHALEALC